MFVHENLPSINQEVRSVRRLSQLDDEPTRDVQEGEGRRDILFICVPALTHETILVILRFVVSRILAHDLRVLAAVDFARKFSDQSLVSCSLEVDQEEVLLDGVQLNRDVYPNFLVGSRP